MTVIDHSPNLPPALSPAEHAVAYLLDRVRMDPDLRWLMLDTQAMHLLCASHAVTTGRDLGEVAEEFRRPYRHPEAERRARLSCWFDLRESLRSICDRTMGLDRDLLDDALAVLRKADQC